LVVDRYSPRIFKSLLRRVARDCCAGSPEEC
jgi:hypothetical protein